MSDKSDGQEFFDSTVFGSEAREDCQIVEKSCQYLCENKNKWN